MRSENVVVWLSHMEYRMACLKAATGLSAYNTTMGWQMATPFTMLSRPTLPPLPALSQVLQQGQWQSPVVTMGGASASNPSLSLYDQQSSPRVPPQLPTSSSLVEQQGPWQSQRQSPSFTKEAATSNTGPSFSTPEQQYSISPQQQGLCCK